jgi:hypothetical protein
LYKKEVAEPKPDVPVGQEQTGARGAQWLTVLTRRKTSGKHHHDYVRVGPFGAAHFNLRVGVGIVRG